MKKKSISLLLAMMLVLSMVLTGCGSKKDEETSSGSTETANKSAKELLTAASEKYEDASKIQNENVNLGLKLNMSDSEMNLAINGNVGMSIFVGDKPQLKLEFNLDKAEDLGLTDNIALVAFADDTCVIFSLDGGAKYYKMSYNVLVAGGLVTQEQVDEIIKQFKDLNAAQDQADKLITDDQKKQAEDMTKKLQEWADEYKVDGTKDINGEKATVIKGTITKENISELVKMVSELAGSMTTDNAAAQGAESELSQAESAVESMPEGLKPINIEFYISEKSGDLIGCNVDFAECLKSIAETDEEAKDVKIGDCVLTMTMGINNTEEIKMPEVDESSMEDIAAALQGLGSMFSSADTAVTE